MDMIFFWCILISGWTAAALIGTQAYFRGEQTKPIHERNWKSPRFHQLAKIFTGVEVDYAGRASSYRIEKGLNRLMANR